MSKNLYAILGVERGAGADEIRAAHDALVAQTQPGDDVRRMALKEAWNVLGHVQRRAAYDASLSITRRKETTAVAEAPAPSRMPWVIGLAVLLLAGSWWAMRAHKKPAPPAGAPAIAQPAAVSPFPAAAAQTAATPRSPTDHTRPLTPEALFAQASASVVRINVFNAAGEGQSLGSGVVTEPGTVVTNCHVTRGGSRVKVRHRNEEYDASVATADEKHDLCRLSVRGLSAQPVEMVKVAHLKVGQKVYAIGSPQGLDLTLSDGMVSSLREGPDGTFVQTTAPVSPGSSGGGLFNERGQLVGIITFQVASGQNLNFAIPTDWIDSMSPSSAPEPERSAPTAASTSNRALIDPQARLILGTWHCFGPLTGRGLTVSFDENGAISGSFDGKPIGGRYQLRNKQLSFDGEVFVVEEMTGGHMVLSRGEGSRIACNR